MEWQDRPVFITGAGGFIGSHLTERLLGLGARVRAMVHGDPQFHAGYLGANAHPNLELCGGDLRDADFVRRMAEGADTIFHLGAVTSVQYSFAHPGETIDTNTNGTVNVCNAARAARVRRLIHTSTGGSYGTAPAGEALTEAHPMVGTSPYTAGKIAADYVVQTYSLSYALPTTTVRLFNAYGPRVSRYLIIPTIIQQFLKGPTIKLGDLTPTRPFLYIDDIVAAFLAAAGTPGLEGETIHFGNAQDTSMGAVVEQIAALMQITPDIQQDPTRMRPKGSEIQRQTVDCAKARALLGWEARVGMEEGLRNTIDWIAAGGYEARR